MLITFARNLLSNESQFNKIYIYLRLTTSYKRNKLKTQ